MMKRAGGFCIIFNGVTSMVRIKELRAEENMKQEDLAGRLKVSRQAVSNYENGSRQLDLSTIEQLCAIFGCTADYLLGLTDTPKL